MTLSSPIGIFDSGIGGLSVARAVRERLPGEDILYVADSRHAPYGDKSDAFIRDRMHMITDFLLAQGAKAVVVACNTATTAAIAELREAFSVPIIGVEPGVKPAVEATRTGVVGVLATPRTLQTHSFEKLAARFSTDVTLLVQPCPQLVRQIEALDFDGDETRALLREYLAPLLSEGADTIVLGCTHYNYLAEQIAAAAGRDITIISTEDAVAREVGRRLDMASLLAARENGGQGKFFTSGDTGLFRRQLDCLWGESAVLDLFEE
ncbi:glutamate racemase [Alcanivorax nanhaiticus]|uniref:Glutamate racemase n=1 Tax=Alcanivorax nanhaiticus TaxID=1177154 RepID=A0A095SNT5_9GAMM|nr:glutamate racemase [Alcanivorax nanhaiticus]KGD66331.1 glutamate racemase [Alcanivorax nanhaiticus]